MTVIDPEKIVEALKIIGENDELRERFINFVAM